jgi:acyl carrier protein
MLDDVATRVRAIIRTLSPHEQREIAAEDRLVEDLGLNSIALMQLSVTLEHEFGLPAISEQAATITTVSELESLVATSRKAVIADD